MRIAFFTDSYLPFVNGVSYSVDTFADRLGREHEVMIFSPKCGSRKNFEKNGKVQIRRYSAIPFPTYKDYQLAIPNVPELMKSVESFNPDVIHFHTPGTMGLLGILMAKRMHKPLVGTYHTLISEMTMYVSPQRIFRKYLRAIDRTVEGLGIDVKLLRDGEQQLEKREGSESLTQKMAWSYANRVYNYADIILCPSLAIKKELYKRGLKKRAEVLSNGLDLEKFPIKQVYENRNKVLHVGRLSFEKNVPVVIEAFKSVTDEFPRASLTIAGGGPAEESLKKLVRDLNLEQKVEFLGTIPREELGRIYRSHDVFVTASTMETQGLVALEAAASGLPIVGVNKYALRDLIKSGRNGYLVAAGDSREMAAAIIRLLKNPQMQEKFGKEGCRMSKSHDMETVIKKIEKIYSELIAVDRKSFREIFRLKLAGWLS
jgi:glycosyltransferase involved in cell wall biosynthesis